LKGKHAVDAPAEHKLWWQGRSSDEMEQPATYTCHL
jgi:hypothetical protein